MLVKEPKSRGFSGNIIFEFNFKGKRFNDLLENKLVAYNEDGNEITEEEYNILSVDNDIKVDGIVDVIVDLNKIKEKYFNNELVSFYNSLKKISFNTTAKIYYKDNETFKETTSSTLIKDYIDSECKFKVRFKDPKYISIKIEINKAIKDSISTIKDNLELNHSIFMQGITLADEMINNTEYPLFSFKLKPPKVTVKREIDINFKNGELPIGSSMEGLGMIFDETIIPGEKVIAFANKGKSSSTASIKIPIELKKDVGLNVEFYCSTEKGYDKFRIYKGTEERLCISGTKIYTVHTNKDSALNLAGDKWCVYPIKNVNGAFELKLSYTKDSSGDTSTDNIFIKRIYSGELEANEDDAVIHDLTLKNNVISYKRSGKTIISLENLKLSKGNTFDILIANNNEISLNLLTPKGEFIKGTSNDVNLTGEITMEVLASNSKYSNCYLDALFIINKSLDNNEIEEILKGTKEGFKRPNVLTGAILSNTPYNLLGNAVLFKGNIPTREVNGDFATTSLENYIVLDEDSKCVRK